MVAGGKVYTLGAMGNLICFNAKSGDVIWSKDLLTEGTVPMWGTASSPLVDGQRLICLVGGKGSVAVAFDKDTGKENGKCSPQMSRLMDAAHDLRNRRQAAANRLAPAGH